MGNHVITEDCYCDCCGGLHWCEKMLEENRGGSDAKGDNQ